MKIPKSESENEVVKNKIADFSKAQKAYYQKTHFTWNFELFIESDSPIDRLVSFSHYINYEFDDEDGMKAIVTLEGSDKSLFDKNFHLVYRNENVNTPSVLAQVNAKETALAISFLTDLASQEEVDKRKPIYHYGPDLDSTNRYFKGNKMVAQEYYFVLDRSGSMTGEPIEVAKAALELFIRSLPPESIFNIISFGTDYEMMFPSPKNYTEDSLNEAIDKIQSFRADLGVTEIYKPLQDIFDDSSVNKKLDKHIFLITDGCVFDPQQVVDLIEENNKRYTTHTFGIGDGVSTELIQKCASAGLGTYSYVNNEAIGLKAKIITALK